MNENKTPEQQDPAAEEQVPSVAPDFGDGKKALIVEDDPTTIELVRKILADHRFDVLEAKNGKDAWDKLRPESLPNVIVCDYLMPEMDGFEFFKGLKEDDNTKNIPVLFLTARKNMEDSLLASGIDAFMSKPLDTDVFLATVQKLLLRRPPTTTEASSEEGAEKKTLKNLLNLKK